MKVKTWFAISCSFFTLALLFSNWSPATDPGSPHYTFDLTSLFIERAQAEDQFEKEEQPLPENTDPKIAVRFENQTSTIAENENASADVKIADIIVFSDDIMVSGDELDDFELTTQESNGGEIKTFNIDGNELFLNSDVKLDRKKQPKLNVTVSVDKKSTVDQPDAQANLELTVRAPIKDFCDRVKSVAENDWFNSKNKKLENLIGPSIYDISLGMLSQHALHILNAQKPEKVIVSSPVNNCIWAHSEKSTGDASNPFNNLIEPTNGVNLFSEKPGQFIPHLEYGLCTDKMIDVEKIIQMNGLLNNESATERRNQILRSKEQHLCLNSLTIRKLKKNKWTSYAKYHFRECYDQKSCENLTAGTINIGDLRVSKIEWKSDWADHSNWLSFARADILEQFKGDLLGKSAPTPHKWLIDNGPVIRYWWSDNQSKGQFAGATRQIQNWDEFRHAYCKCKFSKNCSCDNANKTNKPDTFLTLDISYQPTAVLTISRGPVFDEPWERRQKRYIAQKVHAASIAEYEGDDFLSVEDNSRWMHQSPIKNKSQAGAGNNKDAETK